LHRDKVEESPSFACFYRYLHVTGDTFGRPIHGQKEVCSYGSANELNYWKVSEGIYIRSSEANASADGASLGAGHEEL